MLDGIAWFFSNLGQSFANLFHALANPGLWLSWLDGLSSPEDKQALMRFIYYGGSTELFFVILMLVLIVTLIGLIWRNFMWSCVIVMEGFANSVGRLMAWAGLLMVLQQIVIIFMQRIFAASEISMGLGKTVTRDVSWWAEMLKLENAIIVTLCATYTFVQGSHVRVDLIYSAVGFRAKRVIDMFGAVIFMMPTAVLIWMYGWYFLWRHLVVPKPSASDTLDKLLTKSRALRWNVETIGFSPNGFDAYFLFKILLVSFAAMIFIHAVAFFYRSFLELVEGPDSEHKHLDRDDLGDEEAEIVHAIEEHH
ncbi:TRAP transporter small permease subunit [Pukyongiella litopenaei]|uniref:TRAP transporter small permease protein n=1 Tax=Pukyongiella litopenaei TaxID=2605946 RepID=A0A2S0MT81_9RHOB|nr:C4-dicarboxylate ABC transporter permease [Pukyongiella litopenaei]AVO39104.1 C4-dicarboxylate ABC transporter permease [Pukyongiella litopenaei]